jgi:hypothetical protein
LRTCNLKNNLLVGPRRKDDQRNLLSAMNGTK